MRVTFVLPSFATKPSGGARIVYQYASGLVERGHDVTVVHAAFLEPRQYARPLRADREPKVVARGLVDSTRRRPRSVAWHQVDPRVRLTYVPTLHPRNVPDGDAVVATAWRTAESVARYPRAKGRRFYLLQHYETWDGPEGRVDATWRYPMHKIVIAGWLRERGLALGVPAADMSHVPNPIDRTRFHLTSPIEGRRPRVAMLWSRAPAKGGPTGLDALAAARAQVPDLQAVLFGVRRRPNHLPEWVDYRQNPSPGELVRDVYNGSSVYLCPSLSEGWHLPPAEAMSCGCALVSTDIDGVSDYAIAGRTALLAPVGDAAGLAAAIVSLCRDEAERVRLATAGHQLIRTFTSERSLDALERCLEEEKARV